MLKQAFKGFKSHLWGLVPFIIGLSILVFALFYTTFEMIFIKKELVMSIDYILMWTLFLSVLGMALYFWNGLRDKTKYHYLSVDNVSPERLFKLLSKSISSYEFKEMNKAPSDIPFKNVTRYYYSSKKNLEIIVQEVEYYNLFLQSKVYFKINIGPITERNKKIIEKSKKKIKEKLSKYIIRHELL